MKSAGPVQLVVVLLTITWASSMPAQESTTRRPSQPQIGDTIKQLTSQLMNDNATSSAVTLDTRTPPKVKQQIKKPPKKEEQKPENSHPGIAVPVEEADLVLEESTKNFNFYKIENKPTTDRGLSTWVLLNSQTVSPSSSTTKASRKPVIKQKPEENKNLTAIDAEIFNKITKPLFKKRPLPTTTKKPATTIAKQSTITEKEYKLTKVKASVLSNAIINKNKTEVTTVKKQIDTTTPNVFKKEISLEAENMLEVSTISNKISTSLTSTDDNSILSIESKEDEVELLTTTPSSKKTRRPTLKRKKNKNRRRRPALDKNDTNSTKISNKIKDKPISTQIYNYLSREIMPTVGVGLVGLMVTAGLASYFLYPFGAVRRSYEAAADRKDKEGSYYYKDEYAPGGVAEEEVIGQVIAGMPANSNYDNYRSPSSNLRYKQNDFGFRKAQSQASDAIYLTPSRKYGEDEDTYVGHRSHKPDFYSPQRTYNQDIIEQSQETGYTVDDKQFVVGNIPKELQEATPAVVPEHGPRNLPETATKGAPHGLSEIVADHAPRSLPDVFSRGSKLRKRRSNDMENEISNDDENDEDPVDRRKGEVKKGSSTTETTTVKTHSTTAVEKQPQSFMNTLTNFVEVKIKMGLAWLHSTTKAISRYLSEVQRRFSSKMKASSKEQPRMH